MGGLLGQWAVVIHWFPTVLPSGKLT
jgi:hypothetical protein